MVAIPRIGEKDLSRGAANGLHHVVGGRFQKSYAFCATSALDEVPPGRPVAGRPGGGGPPEHKMFDTDGNALQDLAAGLPNALARPSAI